MLYLIATPIGNLGDFSFRAVEVLSSCDYLLCEDTRRSLILLQRYEIKKRLESYHQENEASKLSFVMQDLQKGMTIGLLSDAGSPLICDPGSQLVKMCIEKQIPFTSIPGPTALIQALILSGLPAIPFQFLGFVPRKESELLALLPQILSFTGTTLLYESPQRLVHTLQVLSKAAPSTEVAIARELTKTFEEVIRMDALSAHEHFVNHPPKGEIVLLIKGFQDLQRTREPRQLVQELIDTYHLSLTEAIKTAAHLLSLPKQSVYKIFHHE
ncbi:MAG: 16S rRNA (cytidine(1402)-2'-O)-methyltransferase [Chlamydiae bacterium]|nr:16S rRNA (cytidine(1402)-2'-O)-methyltransferase [Chlamydiota bacterium]